jgi:hypothetical protein
MFVSEIAPTLPLSGVHAQLNFLMGDVLTIIDASYSSPEQNKAIKDLIKNSFRTKHKWLDSLAKGGDNGGELYNFPGLAE